MSRTYRHRHLPRVDACALKFVDGSSHTANRLIDERVESYYAHVLHDAPCLYGDPNTVNVGFYQSHSRCAYKAGLQHLWWRSEKQLRAAMGLNYPVAGVCCHPLVNAQCIGGTHRRYEGNQGHRRCRRKNKALLNKFKALVCADPGLDALSPGVVEELGLRTSPEEVWLDFDDAFPHTRYEIDPWSWD